MDPAIIFRIVVLSGFALLFFWIRRRGKQCGIWYSDYGTHLGPERCRRPKGHIGVHHMEPLECDKRPGSPICKRLL